MKTRFERFSVALSVLNRCLHRIEAEEMEAYGLRGSYALYLAALDRYQEGLTAARLGEICNKDKAAVSRIVAEMLEKGLILRTGDSYRAILTLTDSGKQAAEHVRKKAQVAVDLAGQDMSDEERAVFYTNLERIAARLQDMTKG